MKYDIPVENMNELRKKAASIAKKANKHDVAITFIELGEVVKEIKGDDGVVRPRKYIEIEAEGEAKFEGWVFAGTIEHTECGNILRSVSDEHKIPERYRNAKPYCEHCKTDRNRKDTYIVYNEETGEFKQVGKSCLKEYTNGLSVEMAACVLQWTKEIEDACYYGGTSYHKMFAVEEVSRYFIETISKFGWASSSSRMSTKEKAMDFYNLAHGNLFPKHAAEVRKEMEETGFDIKNVSDEYLDAAIEWAKSWDGHEYNDYRENLKVIANMKYCEYKHLGYLASLFMAYDKDMEREIKRRKEMESKGRSEYVAEIGNRIELNVKSGRCLTSWENEWGTTFLYEFITEDDDILIWKTSKCLDEDKAKTIKGTVKAHNIYNGIKQTELTRCKLA